MTVGITLEFILRTPISAPSVLWYLWFLWAFYLIALVLVRCSVPMLPVIAVCLIASPFLPDLLRLDRFSFLFAFFLLGNYVDTQSLTSRIGMPLAISGLAAALAGGVISVVGDSIKYELLFAWVPLGLIVFIPWGSQFFRSSRASAPFEWIGRNSIVFYVVHFPVLVFSARLLGQDSGLNGTMSQRDDGVLWPFPVGNCRGYRAAIAAGAVYRRWGVVRFSEGHGPV